MGTAAEARRGPSLSALVATQRDRAGSLPADRSSLRSHGVSRTGAMVTMIWRYPTTDLRSSAAG